MKTAVATCVSCFAISLAFALPANAAHGIRTDTGDGSPNNGWSTCTTNCSLPTGVTLNPFGSNPATGPSPTYTLSDPSTSLHDPMTTVGDLQPASFTDNVPGISQIYTSGPITAQVLYYNLNQSSQTVFGPPNAGGATVALGAGNAAPMGIAWEIAFNYGLTSAIGSPPTTITSPASVDVNGTIYTASASVLESSTSDEFVDYGGKISAPLGWVISSSPGTTEAPELDMGAAGSAITMLLCGLAILKGGQRRVRV